MQFQTSERIPEIIKVLKSVREHFESNGGTQNNIVMTKTAIKKARSGFYGICSDCGHIGTTEEIYKKPFRCSKCNQPFV